MPSEGTSIEEIEIDLLLRGIEARYGYDLQAYRPQLVRQNVESEATELGVDSVSALQEKLLRNDGLFRQFLKRFSPREGYPFQHPQFLKAIADRVFPVLRTYPAVKVWGLDGDLSGLYSLAILMEEAGLLERTTVYFTDVSELILERAKQGRVSETAAKRGEAGYRKAGGRSHFADYLEKDKKGWGFTGSLRKKVECFPFNPLTDSSFNEFNLIVCRGMLADVEDRSRDRLGQLFHDSLGVLGVMAVGDKDNLPRWSNGIEYRRLAKGRGLFQRVG